MRRERETVWMWLRADVAGEGLSVRRSVFAKGKLIELLVLSAHPRLPSSNRQDYLGCGFVAGLLQKMALWRVHSSAAVSLQFCAHLLQVFIHSGAFLSSFTPHNNCLVSSIMFYLGFCASHISSVLTILNPRIPKGVACRSTN